MMCLVRETPFLNAPKEFFAARFNEFYHRLRHARASGVSQGGAGSQLETPIWLADIFGPFETEYSSLAARTVLGWEPLVSLEEGQRVSVEWLNSLGLGEGELRTGASL
jgi:hypothetical protein